MAQTKREIQALLAQAGAAARHRLGQNFMIDGNLVRLLADAAGIVPGDLLIEVGPGTGTLTEELLGRAGEVLAVEIDRHLAALLREKFGAMANFQLIEADALAGKHGVNRQLLDAVRQAKSSHRTVRLVANLPYNIASPLIIELLVAGVDLLAFTVQKEVADRIRAEPGCDDYGGLSITAQLLSDAEVLRTVPRQAFWPMPKIESAMVRLKRRDRLGEFAATSILPSPGTAGEGQGGGFSSVFATRPHPSPPPEYQGRGKERAQAFRTFVQALFSSRRKTLRNALLHAGVDPEKVLATTRISPQIRPEEVSPEECLRLFDAVHAAASLPGDGSV